MNKQTTKQADKHAHKGFLGVFSCSINYYLHFYQYECTLFV